MSNMIYKTNVSKYTNVYSYKIEEVELVKKTAKMYVVKVPNFRAEEFIEQRVAKFSEDAQYHDTFEEAEQFIFQTLQKNLVEAIANCAKWNSTALEIESKLTEMIVNGEIKK